jgi:DNA-binding NarL/FixJ family response regulator
LPDGSGVELCREVLQNHETARVLFLTSYGNDESMLSAVMAGASGYLLKEISPERLAQAIELVADGHRPSIRRPSSE